MTANGTALKMICYRSDMRRFQVGDVVPPPGDHIERMPASFRVGEERLRAHSTGMRDLRSNNLFVYETAYAGTLQFIKYTGNYLYKIEVDREDLLHAADMSIVFGLAEAEDGEHIPLVEAYANGDRRSSRTVEFIVRQAQVVEKIYDKSERLAVEEAIKKLKPEQYAGIGRLLKPPVPDT
jgi:hypothetical protein